MIFFLKTSTVNDRRPGGKDLRPYVGGEHLDGGLEVRLLALASLDGVVLLLVLVVAPLRVLSVPGTENKLECERGHVNVAFTVLS